MYGIQTEHAQNKDDHVILAYAYTSAAAIPCMCIPTRLLPAILSLRQPSPAKIEHVVKRGPSGINAQPTVIMHGFWRGRILQVHIRAS